ncbi:uncharacterized protein LOC121466821 [Drosophila elegans]|uniref:uncharacterized protein LOC121466821 n=1 Tax=Drosophila elegans TaxID=30023 RepID=UPI001BC83840|nr:uncharacterized protein LOC121466821 [Drosophila elegans]
MGINAKEKNGSELRLHSNLYSALYEEFVGNLTVIKCPTKPSVYYLKNNSKEVVLPLFHPPGNFRLIIDIKTEKEVSITAKLIWRYRVMRI